MSKSVGSRVMKEKLAKWCCAAGSSSKCKHVMAVILYLSRIEESDLEDLTCTDLEQQWGALKNSTLTEYEAKQLSELCRVKKKRDVYVSTLPHVSKEMEERWRDKLAKCAVLSEYSLFMSCLRQGSGTASCVEEAASNELSDKLILERLLSFRFWSVMGKVRKMTNDKVQSLDSKLREFYENNVVVNLAQSVLISSLKQGSEAWLEARKLRQTANKARAQYTYYINPKADWDNRYREVFQSTFKGNEHTIAGLRGEILGRDLYEEKYRCTVFQSGLLVKLELPWLGCSLDGTVLDERYNFVKNLEIKTIKEGQRLTAQELLEFECIKTIDQNGNVKVKTDHYAQMQVGMLLSGMDCCDYMVFFEHGKDSIEVNVKFDEAHSFDLCSRLVNVYFEKF